LEKARREEVTMAVWGYGLLGPVEARVGDRVVPLTGARQRLVLAMLLLDANRLVPADRLIDELWGADLPKDPRGALRTQISRLRRALGPAGGELVTEGGGYRLSIRRGQLDAARFEDALAASAGATGKEALLLVDQALDLWRGPALAEFADRPIAAPEAVRLDELRVVARERRAELVLALGAPGDATAALQAVVAEHPERERARGLLMQALYRGGRHTEALAAFESWRRYLSEELGLDPSPALRHMEQDILRHSLTPAEPRAKPAYLPLPLPVTSFIGREGDCAAVAGLLSQVRLLTLHGPGGVGKTRLALEVISRVGARYRDGACFCDLAAIQRPAAVTRAIATATGLTERAFIRLDNQLIEHLASRQQLLLIDNCEHVADGVAVIAERLLRETRDVTVLATSRDRLGIDGEHIWPVTPLPADGPDAPAVRLFLDRACAADPAARHEPPDGAVVTALCARLDGLPLAIELAAARLPGTTVSELAASLQDRFRLLTVGHRADSRHQSLRAVMDWSYEQLPPSAQELFGQLSVFHGWFDISAARAVTAWQVGGPDAAHAVLHLTDRSLITADRTSGGTRYRLLETLRSYGLERLEERGELAAARSWHAHWAVDLVTQAAAGLRGADEARWAAALDSHFDDLRAAHSWLSGHDTRLSLRMTAELHWYALSRCQSEVFRWADVSAAAAAGSSSQFYPEALASAAFGAIYRGDLQAGDSAAQAALAAARGQDPMAARRPLQALGDVAIFGGDPKRAASLYREAYDLSVNAGDYLDAAWDAASAAAALAYGNQLAQASRLAGLAEAAATASGAPTALALAAWATGEIAAVTDPVRASEHLRRAAALATTAGSRLVSGLAEVSLAGLYARHGDAATALGYFRQVIPQWRQAGAWTPQWVTIRTLIDLLTRVGACRDAATLYGAATSATTGAPPYGADADRMREIAARLQDTLTATGFRACAAQGERLDAHQVIDLALDAIARATAAAAPA
jgi:predicted ATPase/DNA-binding SARP family transcriptional activator